MTPTRARRKFPQLNNDEIKYCSVFYEGMHDDARTNLAIALTAATHGAAITNYTEVVDLISESGDNQSQGGRVVGAIVRDRISGELITVRAKSVLICGGPFTDSLRKMESGEGKPFASAVTGSSGIHIVLPSYFAPPSFGFVDMSTSDGRFMFFLPWEGHIVVGTTDHKCKADNFRPEPSENEIQWILNELSKYLSPELKVQRKHVLSAWSGIRPLAIDPHNLGGADGSTAAASRDHIVSHNPESGVVFVAGGKWTTYREMAEDGIDKLVKVSQLYRRDGSKVPASSTLTVPLVGKDGYSETLHIQLLQEFGDSISISTASHLVRAYGGRARDVLHMKPLTIATTTNINSSSSNSNNTGNLLTPLVKGYPYVEAEVVYAVRNEYALRIEDIIARRTRLAFLNREAALSVIPRVAHLMKAELGWSDAQMAEEIRECVHFLQSFGGPKPNRNELGTTEGKYIYIYMYIYICA